MRARAGCRSGGARSVLGAAASLWLGGAALLGAAADAAGQVPGPDARALGRAHGGVAVARGLAAPTLNPAGLGMATEPGFSVALPVLEVGTRLGPVGLADVAAFEGRTVPIATREEWLRRVEAGGGQTGGGAARLTPLAVGLGRVALRVSTTAAGTARLNPDAVELLLFGNSGRSGSAGDFTLEGSRLDLFAASTFSAGVGVPVLEGATGPRLAVGATLKRTVGHALALARDDGSRLEGDPVAIDVAFPLLHTRTGAPENTAGRGFGLDLGVAAESGRWALGAAVHDVVSTFAWDEASVVYRPGRALFEADRRRADVAELPLAEAPHRIRRLVDEAGFGPKLGVGAAYRASPTLTVSADFRRGFGGGLDPGPRTRVGGAVETAATSFLALRAGAARTGEGFELAAGGDVRAGPVSLTLGALLRPGGGGAAGHGTTVALGLSYER